MKRIAVAALILVLLAAGGWFFLRPQPVDGGVEAGYAVYRYGQGGRYDIRFYDVGGNVAATTGVNTGLAPTLTAAGENLIEMRVAATGFTYFCRYFNRETGALSPLYQGPAFVAGSCVALAEWLEGKAQIALRDIATGELLASAQVDFADEPYLAGCLVSAREGDGGTVEVAYLSRDASKEKTHIFSISE